MFNITKVKRLDSESVEVLVTIDVKVWTKYRDSGWLGSLYGIDISNAVYKAHGVKAHCPSVGDRDKAKNGIKTISLIYADTTYVELKNLVKPSFKQSTISQDDLAKLPLTDNTIKVDFIARKRVA